MAGTGNPELDREIDRMQSQVRQALEIADKLGELIGEAESEDRYIRATVKSNGMLNSLEINPRAMKQGSEALAETITKTILEAQESLSRQSQELMAPLTADMGRLQEMTSRGTIQDLSDSIGQSPSEIMRSENPVQTAAQQLERLRKMM
jgi:DNA-binding protein YbaB